MKAIFWAGVGTLFPFAMTVLGAALVFLFRDSRNGKTEQVCMGFAAGVMSAAAVFSMLIPAVEQTKQSGGVPWRMATLGFALGAMMIACVDAWMRRMKSMQTAEDDARRRTLMYTAITLHNIPEGMAVGLARKADCPPLLRLRWESAFRICRRARRLRFRFVRAA